MELRKNLHYIKPHKSMGLLIISYDIIQLDYMELHDIMEVDYVSLHEIVSIWITWCYMT